jgi:hypothetical protein
MDIVRNGDKTRKISRGNSRGDEIREEEMITARYRETLDM